MIHVISKLPSEQLAVLRWFSLIIQPLIPAMSPIIPNLVYNEDIMEESSTLAGERQDLYLFSNDVVMFAGEAKRDKEDIDVAKKELITKMSRKQCTISFYPSKN